MEWVCNTERGRVKERKNMTTICVGVWDTLCIRNTHGIWIRPKKFQRIQPKVDSNIWTGDHSICKSYVKGIQSSFRFSTYNICTSTYIDLYSSGKWFPICIQTRECLLSRVCACYGVSPRLASPIVVALNICSRVWSALLYYGNTWLTSQSQHFSRNPRLSLLVVFFWHHSSLSSKSSWCGRGRGRGQVCLRS